MKSSRTNKPERQEKPTQLIVLVMDVADSAVPASIFAGRQGVTVSALANDAGFNERPLAAPLRHYGHDQSVRLSLRHGASHQARDRPDMQLTCEVL